MAYWMHTIATIPILVIVLSQGSTSEDSCTTGRIYLGNLNLSLVDYIQYMGVYEQEPHRYHHHRPVYRHQHRHLHMYFTVSDLVSRWVIQPNVTDNLTSVAISSTSAPREPLASEHTHWRLKMAGEWSTIQDLKSVCVSQTFKTCTTGILNISGLSSRTRKQHHFMGTYLLQNVTKDLRPVYRHSNSTAVLMFKEGFWVFKRQLNSSGLGMFTTDKALYPELILQPWTVFNGYGFRREPISITCSDPGIITLEEVASGQRTKSGCFKTVDEEAAVKKIEETGQEGGQRGEDEEEALTGEETNRERPTGGGCAKRVCGSGGEMIIDASHGTVTCRCKDGYYGPTCETEIQCGEPPVPASTILTRIEQTGLLTLAFYSCHPGYFIDGASVAVCGPDSRWQHVPACTTYMTMPLGGVYHHKTGGV